MNLKGLWLKKHEKNKETIHEIMKCENVAKYQYKEEMFKETWLYAKWKYVLCWRSVIIIMERTTMKIISIKDEDFK